MHTNRNEWYPARVKAKSNVFFLDQSPSVGIPVSDFVEL